VPGSSELEHQQQLVRVETGYQLILLYGSAVLERELTCPFSSWCLYRAEIEVELRLFQVF